MPHKAVSICQNLCMTPSEIPVPIEEWETQIGRFVVAFARIEFILHEFVQVIGSRELHRSTVNDQIKPRIACVRKLLQDSDLLPGTRTRVQQAFQKLERLYNDRNLIVHNGVVSEVIYPDEEDGSYVIRHVLRSARDVRKSITPAVIAERTAEAKELSREFSKILSAVVIRRQKLRAAGPAPEAAE